MGVLKTLCLGSVLALATAPQSHAEEALLTRVSECVGRLSAQMEHHWLFQDEGTDAIEMQRGLLIDILGALTTSENASRVLSGRIDAKMAHASLLTQAAFAQNAKVADWAQKRAHRQIRMCDGIALAPTPPVSSDRLQDARVPEAALTQEAWNASQ